MSKSKKSSQDLSSYSAEELREELARRAAESLPDSPTMTDMELAVEKMFAGEGPERLAAMVSRLPPETGKPKRCRECGKLAPVKARNRSRTVKSLSGPVTIERNYHYCKHCKSGFYPVDHFLGLPVEGEVTSCLEERSFDFSVSESFEAGAERWNFHYRHIPASANLLRRVADRVGDRMNACHEAALQHELKLPPRKRRPDLVIVQTDGGMVPTRGAEPWKEAKLAVICNGEHYLPRSKKKRGMISQSRYIGVLGKQAEFRESLDVGLKMERALAAKKAVWVGDGAPSNWRLADQLLPRSVQVLDWYHAIEHAMDCARDILDENVACLELWKNRVEELLIKGQINTVITELEQCLFVARKRHRKKIQDLLRYFRNNRHRMNYSEYLADGLPIGSGIVESAHRHVIQKRMKNAGQHWSLPRGRRMVRLRAAYKTAGPKAFMKAIANATRLTQPGKIPNIGRQKRRASNK